MDTTNDALTQTMLETQKQRMATQGVQNEDATYKTLMQQEGIADPGLAPGQYKAYYTTVRGNKEFDTMHAPKPQSEGIQAYGNSILENMRAAAARGIPAFSQYVAERDANGNEIETPYTQALDLLASESPEMYAEIMRQRDMIMRQLEQDRTANVNAITGSIPPNLQPQMPQREQNPYAPQLNQTPINFFKNQYGTPNLLRK